MSASQAAPRLVRQDISRRALAGPPPPRQRPPVDLSTYLRMDPHLLLGLLNTELRNHCDSLDDLVKTHGLDAGKLVEKMAKAGYDYMPAQNQFR